MYLYNEPVKYKDKDGKIKDKSTKISEKKDDKNGNKYETTENDIKVIFPDSISDGLSLQYGELNIKLTPITEKEAKNIKKAEKAFSKIPSDVKENEKVKYSGVFGDKTEILYTPIFSGIKEDIVLNEYTGQSEFSFTLNTNGLTLCNENGYICLVDPLTGVEVASVGDIITYDSNDENSIGSINTKTIKEDNEYKLTIIVDEEFLKDEKTVYPVYVDPTITIFSNGLGGDIQDTILWNTYTSAPAGENNDLYIGNYYARSGMVSYGYLEKGRVLLKFPGLYNNTTIRNLSKDNINSVKLVMYDFSPLSSSYQSTIYCYRMGQNWTESTSVCTWSLWNGYTGSSLDNKLVYSNNGVNSSNTGSGNYYRFNITNAVKNWKDGYYGGLSNNYGVMLKAADESKKAVKFASAQKTSSVPPSLIVDYDTNIVATQLYLNATNITLNVGETFQLVPSTNPSNADTDYSFDGTAPYYNASSNGLVTGVSSGTANLLVYEHISGLSAYCSVTVVAQPQIDIQSNYVTYIGEKIQLNAIVTPSTHNVNYSIASSTPSGIIQLNSSTGEVEALNEGTVKVKAEIQGFPNEWIYTFIYIRPIRNGTYFIKNKQTKNYIDIDDGNHDTVNAILEQYDMSGGESQKWIFNRNTDGYYTIKSKYSNYNMTAPSSSGQDVKQCAPTGAYNQQWKLTLQNDNSFKIYPRSNINLALNANGSSQGNDIHIGESNDEWLLVTTRDASFIGVNDDGHDHTSFYTSSRNYLNSFNPSYNNIKELTDPSEEDCIEALVVSKIFISRSHGAYNKIFLDNSLFFPDSMSIGDIESLSDDALSNVELVYYGACLTAKGGYGATNLVNSTNDKGAQTVIGFKESVPCTSCNQWTDYFLQALANGDNVYYACIEANTHFSDNNAIKTCYIAGDSAKTFN